MDTSLFVSIIINNYNYDRFLAQAIDSSLAQTYPNLEVIVVDDGSTDNSREIISGYGDLIIPILQPNGKQAAAFNSGFSRSKGEIIIFLDSDDYLLPHAVEQIVAVWKTTLAKVHYRLEVVDADGKPMSYTFPQGKIPLSKGEVWKSLLNTGGYVRVPTSGNALNRNALVPLFPIADEYKLTADDYLSVLIPFYGEVEAIEEPLGAYRIHASNQWALATVTGERFHRFIKHELVVDKLLFDKAKELSYELPQDFELRSMSRFQVRLASLRLAPESHPIAQDQRFSLVRSGIQSIWRYSNLSWSKQLIYTFWFLWVGLMPLPLARPAITWLFSPQSRPKFLGSTLKKFRPLVN